MRALVIAMIISSGAFITYDIDNSLTRLIPDKETQNSIPAIMRFYGNIERGDGAREFFAYMGKCMDSFDLDEFYESSYFTTNETGFRTFTFHGSNELDHIKLDIYKPGYDNFGKPECGEFFSEYGLKRNEAKDNNGIKSFSFYIKSKTSWGSLSLLNILSFFEGFLKVFDPDNIARLPDPPASPVFPHLTGYNRKVCDAYYMTFPGTTAYLDRYCTAPPLLEIKNHNGVSYTHVKAKLIYKQDVIKKEYPLLEDYFKELSGNFKININLLSGKGHSLCKFEINGMDYMTADVYTRGGEIIPFDINGMPRFDEAFSMEKITNLDFLAEVGMDVKQFGLRVGMTMIFFGNYYRTRNKEMLGYKLIEVKNIITGNFLNVIPFEVLDTVTMGNIDEFMKEFTAMLINANKGKGTFLLHKWTKDDPGDVINNYYLSTEILDNFFIRFGMKMFSNRFEGKKDARLQMGELLRKFFVAFIDDVNDKEI